ncbi:hypothetical protein [Granulicella sp. L60]|jgi:hypothetical protein|uniref:hypothetical protein n=1 Tax=Granulicella sp. L60 TaxID=1641866 RepID=UPI00131C28AB|nr:hypothetical protein [Granulicella sp. L60]
MKETLEKQESYPDAVANPRMWMVNLTSLLFILLQSACTAVIALSGISAAIGLGSFAAALGLNRLGGSFHNDVIRIPMMAVALIGSLINLYVLWRVRSLRTRPASQWRIRVSSSKQRRAELFQFSISLLTVALVIAEWVAHEFLHRHH